MGRNPSGSKRNPIFRLGLLAVLIIGNWYGAVQCSSQEPDPEAVVRQRLTAYWDAMQRADYEVASKYIHEDSRADFIYRTKQAPVAAWRIRSVRCNDERTICDTVVIATRPVPAYLGLRDAVDWPTEQQWLRVADGQWYIKLPSGEGINSMMGVFRRAGESGNSPVAVLPSGTTAPPPIPGSPGPRELVPDSQNPVFLHRGEKATFRYQYSNRGSTPIRIVSAQSDGSYLTFQGMKAEVLPGQSATLEILIDTFGLPDGAIQKRVSVQFSDQTEPVSFLLRTETVPNFAISPAALDFGVMTMGKPVEKTVRIVNESGRKVKLLSVRKADPQLTVSLDKSELNPGESCVVTFRCQPAEEGDFLDSPMIRTDLPSELILNIQVRGRITR